jgi:hypothetical protein
MLALRALCGSVELNFLHGGAVVLTYAYRFDAVAG